MITLKPKDDNEVQRPTDGSIKLYLSTDKNWYTLDENGNKRRFNLGNPYVRVNVAQVNIPSDYSTPSQLENYLKVEFPEIFMDETLGHNGFPDQYKYNQSYANFLFEFYNRSNNFIEKDKSFDTIEDMIDYTINELGGQISRITCYYYNDTSYPFFRLRPKNKFYWKLKGHAGYKKDFKDLDESYNDSNITTYSTDFINNFISNVVNGILGQPSLVSDPNIKKIFRFTKYRGDYTVPTFKRKVYGLNTYVLDGSGLGSIVNVTSDFKKGNSGVLITKNFGMETLFIENDPVSINHYYKNLSHLQDGVSSLFLQQMINNSNPDQFFFYLKPLTHDCLIFSNVPNGGIQDDSGGVNPSLMFCNPNGKNTKLYDIFSMLKGSPDSDFIPHVSNVQEQIKKDVGGTFDLSFSTIETYGGNFYHLIPTNKRNIFKDGNPKPLYFLIMLKKGYFAQSKPYGIYSKKIKQLLYV